MYEFQNRKFVDWVREIENKEAHEYCKLKVKESLIIEQNPDKRNEELILEKLGEDETL